MNQHTLHLNGHTCSNNHDSPCTMDEGTCTNMDNCPLCALDNLPRHDEKTTIIYRYGCGHKSTYQILEEISRKSEWGCWECDQEGHKELVATIRVQE